MLVSLGGSFLFLKGHTIAFVKFSELPFNPLQYSWGFPGGSACNAGDPGTILGLGGFPWWGGYGNPLQYSCLENPHGQRSLVGYNPWGHKESDTTEQLTL